MQQRAPSSQTAGLFYSGGTALKLYSRAGIISAAVQCAVQLQLLTLLFQTNPYPSKDGSGGGEMASWGGASLPPTAGYYAGYDHPTLAAYG